MFYTLKQFKPYMAIIAAAGLLSPGVAYSQNSYEDNVKEIVRICTDEIDKVEESINLEVPKEYRNVQTNAAYDNILWINERMEVLCRSRDYWKDNLDKFNTGMSPKDEDVNLAETVYGIVGDAYKEWQDIISTFHKVLAENKERIDKERADEIKRKEEERLRKLKEEEEAKKARAKEEYLRTRKEMLQRKFEKRKRLQEEAKAAEAAKEEAVGDDTAKAEKYKTKKKFGK